MDILANYKYWAMFYALAMGIYAENIRLIQLPMVLGFLVHYNFESLLSSILYAILTGITIALKMTYGNNDFSKYPDCPEAPFDCGYRVVRTSKFGNEVQVFYPIDKGDGVSNRKKYPDAPYLPHDDDTLKGLAMLVFKFMPSGWAGPHLFSQLKRLMLGVFAGAPIS